MITTTNGAESMVRAAVRAAGDGAAVSLRLVDGSTVTGTVQVDVAGDGAIVKAYLVSDDATTWMVPAGHITAVGVAPGVLP